METRRLILAIALSAVVLMLWSMLFPTPKAPSNPPVSVSDSQETAQRPEIPTDSVAGNRPADESTGGTDTQAEVDETAIAATTIEPVHIETAMFKVVLSNLGAVATSWKLIDYPARDGSALELFPQFAEDGHRPFAIDLSDQGLSSLLNSALYQVERVPISDGQRIVFSWADGRGLTVTKTFTFRNDDYLVDVDLDVVDRGRRLGAAMVIGPGFGAQELGSGRSNYYYSSQVLWNGGGVVTRRKPKKIKEEAGLAGDIRWAGLEDQYFTALLIPEADLSQVHVVPVMGTPTMVADGDEVEAVRVPMVAVSVPENGAHLYIGPKRYKLLQEIGHDLEKAVWFSSQAWLAWIVKKIYLGLLWIHDHTVPNYGLAIILATVVLRLLLFPINQFAMVSMKRTQLQMSRLQPKIKTIKNRYKKLKDAQSRGKMNQEMMELYRNEGVNPMGGVTGCVPLFAQFPILIGFYNMLTVAVELRGAPFFGWIQDLAVKDPLYVTPLLMGVTMFAQQKMAMSKITDPQQQQQQKIMMFMPFMFTIICVQMPAGLVLYWFVNNLLGIGQQYLVNRQTGRLEEAAQAQKA